MKRRATSGIAAAWLATAAVPCFAQGQPGDPVKGLDLSRRLCSNCHATDPEGVDLTRLVVPSFRIIANSPRTTPERIAGAIIIPHPDMPGVSLTRTEMQSIIAYIMSLRREP